MRLLYLLSLANLAGLAQAFRNPILPGFNPDPSLLVVGEEYFVTTSTFEIFPGHPIYHSKDLVDWKLIGHAINRPSQLTMDGLAPEAGLWAPTLRYHDGKYYLFTASRWVYTPEVRLQSRSFYVTTDNPWANSWSDPIYVDVLGYDADIFVDDDGTAYVTRCDVDDPATKIYGIYQVQIDLATGHLLTPDRLISTGYLPNNATARPEGPHVYKKDGVYYLVLAEGGSSVYHRVSVFRGPSPSGPWESNPANPVVYNGVDPDPTTQPIQFTGHADLAQLPDGTWWSTLLGIRPQGGDIRRAPLGRETFLAPVEWNDAGWPVFNGNVSIGSTGAGLHNLSDPLGATSFHDDFDSTELDLSYYFLRTPRIPFHTVGDGKLRIQGSPFSLGNRESPALLLRKQSAFNQRFETVLDFNPKTGKEEAGITIFYSDIQHSEIGIRLCPSVASLPANATLLGHSTNATRCVVNRLIYSNNGTGIILANATVSVTSYHPIAASGPVKLAIQSENTRYSFGFSEGGLNDTVTYIGAVDSLQLYSAPPGYFLFKGVHWGMYSQGGGRNMFGNAADFQYWKQETFAED